MEKIKAILKQNLLIFIGIAIGALAGYLYWYYIGCTTGTCPIKSSAPLTMIWGAAICGLLFSMFKKNKK